MSQRTMFVGVPKDLAAQTSFPFCLPVLNALYCMEIICQKKLGSPVYFDRPLCICIAIFHIHSGKKKPIFFHLAADFFFQKDLNGPYF